MSPAAVLLPVFVQVALTFGLLLWMGSRRIGAIRQGQVAIPDIALGERRWPTRIVLIQNAYENQFELPLLFYALIALALVTAHVTLVLVAASWVFVGSRIVHAFIHVTSNDVPRRFAAYCVGLAVLMAMWIWFLALVVLA